MKKNSDKTEQIPKKDVNGNTGLLQKITELVSSYPDYNSPYMRGDGDIIITLDPNIKRKRKTTQNLTDAIKTMMDGKHPVRTGK